MSSRSSIRSSSASGLVLARTRLWTLEAASQGHDFDLLTFRMRSRLETRDQRGRPIEVDCDERWYIPSELTWLLKQAGFASVGILGAKLGAFSRSDALTPDDFEMPAVAVKS